MLIRLEAWAARLALRLLRALGPVASSNLGGAIARTIGPKLPVSRVADANLRMAMPELDAASCRDVVRGVWENLGRTVGELPHVASLARTPSGPGWELEGEEHIAELIRRGGPMLLFSGHIGNWEILPRASSQIGLPLASFYRAADNPALDAIVTGLRQQANGAMPLFPKGARGARDALSHVVRGGSLAFLIDQKMNDGIEARFFGRPAMTANALASMALHRRLPVIGAHVVRLAPARFRIIVDPPLVLPDSGDRQADMLALTQAVNDSLERWIRQRPSHWLWLHRRWKVTEASQEPGPTRLA